MTGQHQEMAAREAWRCKWKDATGRLLGARNAIQPAAGSEGGFNRSRRRVPGAGRRAAATCETHDKQTAGTAMSPRARGAVQEARGRLADAVVVIPRSRFRRVKGEQLGRGRCDESDPTRNGDRWTGGRQITGMGHDNGRGMARRRGGGGEGDNGDDGDDG